METNQITHEEFADLVYTYVSISTFVLLSISKITETLEKALNFNPTTSLLIILNIIVFVTLHLYKRKHNIKS